MRCAWGDTPRRASSSRWRISQRENVRDDTPAAFASSAFVIDFIFMLFYCWLLAVAYWLLVFNEDSHYSFLNAQRYESRFDDTCDTYFINFFKE